MNHRQEIKMQSMPPQPQMPPVVTVGEMHQETNERIYNRNIPSQPLQPYIDVRPVSTKYSYLPIVDPRKQLHVPAKQMPIFNTRHTFNPGNTQSPYSGFATNINTESELRNQLYALQKCSQSVYVPSSTSDLYTPTIHANNMPNPHSLLFEEQTFQSFNPNPAPEVCGSNLFYNTTRCQIKELTKQKC